MSDVSEDALYEALVDARDIVAQYAGSGSGWHEYVKSAALLEAARLIRAHEMMGGCNDDGSPLQTHGSDCAWGRWVRAAERAGL